MRNPRRGKGVKIRVRLVVEHISDKYGYKWFGSQSRVDADGARVGPTGRWIGTTFSEATVSRRRVGTVERRRDPAVRPHGLVRLPQTSDGNAATLEPGTVL